MNICKNINIYYAPFKTCNLFCKYCYLPESFKRSRKKDDKEIIENIETLIKKIEQEGFRINSFTFHGSEPSLILPAYFGKIINIIKKHWEKNKIKNQKVCMQTNGLNTDIKYLKEIETLSSKENFNISISIDFPPQVHDYYRNNSFEKVYKNYKDALNNNFNISILTVVNKKTIEYLNDFYYYIHQELDKKKYYSNLKKIKIKFASGKESLDNSMMEEFAIFLDKYNLFHITQIFTPGYCFQNGNDCFWLEFDSDGYCYSCNKTFTENGNFANWYNESISDIIIKRKNLFKNYYESKECYKCPYQFICNSGCPVDRYKEGDMKGKSLECVLVKKTFEMQEKKGVSPFKFLKKYRFI
ncbi:MAG TPA: radical SAM protein [Spirochaetota bacterium]|nr:radical SAM protein [Spirochaetota bacterium]HOM37684.1 radical SAM protein [Spirochaetota bacterium]HPQ49642.1 radical SAM protein [Spirochaetota bacterium]